MALQVWLPLTGNLENKGLSNFNITSIESSPTYVNGKIGKCYQRANTSSQITNGLKIDNNLVNLLGSAASVAVWVKPLGAHTHYNGTILSSGNWNSQRWAFGVSQDNSQVDVLCRGHNTYITCAVPVNEWTHLVSTFDNGTCKLYKNGAYIGQLTGQAAFVSDDTWTGIGRESYANGYFGFNGCINDLRIYDHCLTPLEVKEISQGLVLHYQLDGYETGYGNPNLFVNSDFHSRHYWTTGWDTTKNGNLLANIWEGYNSGVSNASTCYHAHLKLFENEYVYEYKKETETWLGISQGGLQTKLVAGNTYTFSCEQYSVTNTNYMTGGLYYYKTGASSAGFYLGQMSCNSNRQQGVWQKFTYTFVAPTDGDYSKTMSWYCYGMSGGAGSFYLRHIKLEEGANATPWCLADSELAIDKTKVFDSSGYAHNGTIINNPILDAPSPRYCICMHFNATNQKVRCGTLNTTAFGNSYSFAWWAKMASNGPMHWGFSDGNRLNGLYNGTTWNTGDGNSNPLYNPGTTTQVTAPTAGVWHHFVMTGDGTTCKVYQDGVLWATAKTYKPINGTQIFINGWADATSYSSDNYSISDFRIYATALSADDVKKLYETSMSIDSAGNISARLLN